MSFLFGKKDKKPGVREAAAQGASPAPLREKEKLSAAPQPQVTPGSSVNNSLNSLGPGDQGRMRGIPEQQVRLYNLSLYNRAGLLTQHVLIAVCCSSRNVFRTRLCSQCGVVSLVATTIILHNKPTQSISEIWCCCQCCCVKRRRYLCYGRLGERSNCQRRLVDSRIWRRQPRMLSCKDRSRRSRTSRWTCKSTGWQCIHCLWRRYKARRD